MKYFSITMESLCLKTYLNHVFRIEFSSFNPVIKRNLNENESNDGDRIFAKVNSTEYSIWSIKTNSVISGAGVMSPTMVSTTVSTVSTNTTPTLPVTPRKYLNITCLDSPCNGYDCFSESDNGLNFRCVCPFPTIGPTCLIGLF